MYLSDLTRRLRPGSVEGFELHEEGLRRAKKGQSIIFLSIGDTDFDTPDGVRRTANASLDRGRTHYAPFAGTHALRTAIARDQNRVDGLGWTEDNVVVFQGAQSALYSAVLCVADSHSDVLAFEPMYGTFASVIEASGAGLITVPFKSNRTGPRIERSILGNLMTDRVSAVLVNSPNNPAGYVLDEQEISTLAKFCVERDIWLITDEIYRDFTYDWPFVPIASQPEMADRTIVVNSLSKSHAMTGWRLGWTLAPSTLVPHLQALKQCSLFSSPTFVEDAAVHALEHERGFVRELASEMRRRRDIVVEGLRACTSFTFEKPAGGMFLLLDVSETGLDGNAFAAGLLDEEGVVVIPGKAYGASCSHLVRVGFCAAPGELAEGARRICRFADARDTMTATGSAR